MRVGRPIYDNFGRLLLARGQPLTDGYIRQLRRLGVAAIYVLNDLAPDVDPPDVISEETRRRLTDEMRRTLDDVRRTVDTTAGISAKRWAAEVPTRLQQAVSGMVDELLSNKNALVHLNDIRSADEYTLGHSVSVCVLSTMVGMTMQYDYKAIRDLAMGALLHDVGKTLVPAEVLGKEGKLSPEEMKTVQKHTVWGYEILRQQPEFRAVSAHVALQHHERWDGKGYPRGLVGPKIHPFARICCVVDVYDALISDRPYRPGFSVGKALEIMIGELQGHFDPGFFQAFRENLALYPIGSLVQLNNGDAGIVVHVQRGQVSRPLVRILWDKSGSSVASPREIDLGMEPSLFVARLLNDNTDGRLPTPQEYA